MNIEQERKRFEAWISKPPFEKVISRFPNDERVTAWPGQYRDINVDLAWNAWREAVNGNEDVRHVQELRRLNVKIQDDMERLKNGH